MSMDEHGAKFEVGDLDPPDRVTELEAGLEAPGVPRRELANRGGAGVAVAERRYEAVEPEPDPGDVLTVVERRRKGLVRCRGRLRSRGWIPFDKTEPLEMGGAPPRSTWRP
jgi:hypothetical protein